MAEKYLALPAANRSISCFQQLQDDQTEHFSTILAQPLERRQSLLLAIGLLATSTTKQPTNLFAVETLNCRAGIFCKY
jgi:hypothetical protein